MTQHKRYKSTKQIDRLVWSSQLAKAYHNAAARPIGDKPEERIVHKWTRGMAEHFRRQFGHRLRETREKAGLSLRALAEQAGVDHAQLVRLESGQRTCTLETAVDIAAALGVNLGILVATPK